MRVHGDKVIRRRTDVVFQNDYKRYEPDLQIDFFHMCGYCGKHEMVSHRGMEPDHFVPERIDPLRKCDYANLVYSCFTCNRKKLGKWPTNDKNRPNDGQTGFVDPATEEYDKHLGRTKGGELEYYTPVGQYMYEKAFKFDIRPTKIIWKASVLYQLSSKLKESIDRLTQDVKDRFINISKELTDLQQYLFDNKE